MAMEDESRGDREQMNVGDFLLGLGVGIVLGGVIVGYMTWADNESKWRRDAVIQGFAAYSMEGEWRWNSLTQMKRQWEREIECESARLDLNAGQP